MELLKILSLYVIWFLTVLILDFIWLWYITKDFIIKEFWDLITIDKNLTIQIKLYAWLIVWFIISIMIVTFVTLKYDNLWDIILYWALLGFFSYSIYDLTNLAFINNYSLKFTIVDILWWSFVSCCVAVSTFYFYNFIK